MALYGGMEAVGLYRQGAEKLSDGLFAGLTFLGVVLAAFCSLYLGTEYQDGTLRNKVTAGYRREQIYFSCLLACLGGGLLIWGSYLAAYLAVGLPLLGGKMGDWALVGGSCLGTLLLLMVYVCLYTCLVSWLQAKATAAAAAILLAFAMLFGGLYLYNRLDEPPSYPDSYRQENGQMLQQPGGVNPNYLQGKQRVVYEILYDLLPDGQGMQILSGEVASPPGTGEKCRGLPAFDGSDHGPRPGRIPAEGFAIEEGGVWYLGCCVPCWGDGGCICWAGCTACTGPWRRLPAN